MKREKLEAWIFGICHMIFILFAVIGFVGILYTDIRTIYKVFTCIAFALPILIEFALLFFMISRTIPKIFKKKK